MARYMRRELEDMHNMPFDRADDSGFGLVHATGYQYYDPYMGHWYDEYENDPSYIEAMEEAERG